MIVGNAVYLAWADTKARYKKSVIGPIWLTLGNLLGVVGLSIVWSALLGEAQSSFVPSVSLGLILWQFISGCVSDGPSVFTRHANIIKNVSMPHAFFVMRCLFRHIINLAHNVVIIAGLALFYKFSGGNNLIYSFAGLILVTLNLFWIMYLLGLLGARYRDIEFFVTAILPLLFFLSPVIFRPDQLPIEIELIWYNPLSYFIEVVRAPLLGKPVLASNYVIMSIFLLIGSLLTWWYVRRSGKNLAFWV
jgi:ABC-type polysaccharide/polyol phosphate export permease